MVVDSAFQFLSQAQAGSTLNLLLQLGAQSFMNVSGRIISADATGVRMEFDEVMEGALFERLTFRHLVMGDRGL